jgi:hypothetical protein
LFSKRFWLNFNNNNNFITSFLSSRLRALDPPIPLGRVGVPDQIEVAKRFGIGGYPLLIVFRHGKQYNFTGEKNEDGELVMVVTNTCHIIFRHFPAGRCTVRMN